MNEDLKGTMFDTTFGDVPYAGWSNLEWHTPQSTPKEKIDGLLAYLASVPHIEPNGWIMDPDKYRRYIAHLEYVEALYTSARVGYG